MDAFTENHIAIHIYKYEDTNVLKIIPVEKSFEYIDEFQKIHNVTELTNYKCIYNCARWYERIMDDLKYKKFRNINLQYVKKGIWIVKLGDPSIIMEDFFSTYLYPYINLKIIGFQEDEEVESVAECESYLNKFLSVAFEDISIAKHLDIKYCETNKDVLYTLKNADVLGDSFILTDKDIFAILLAFLLDKRSMLYCQEKNNKDGNEDKDSKKGVEEFVLRKCSSFNVFEINRPQFTTRQFVSYFNVLNIDHMEYMDLPHKNSKFIRYSDKISPGNDLVAFPGWINRNEGTIDLVDGFDSAENYQFLTNGLMLNSLSRSPLADFGPLFNIDKAHNCLDDELKQYIDKCVGSKNIDTLKECTTENTCYVYFNIISEKQYHSNDKLKYFSEYKLLHDMTFSSIEGKQIFDLISDKLTNNSIYKDLQMLLKVFSEGCESATVENDEVEIDTPESMQRLYTKNYIQKYKNDDAETLASHVIEKVFFYLSQYLQPQDINMNKIGQDLVQLGVKKTRKSKGNVYCIDDPKKEDLISTKDNNSSSVIKKNCQLRKDPEIIVNKASVGPWYLSSHL